jgi:UrcA family protein
MKTRINTRLIRNTLIAVTAMTLPMLASASPNISVAFNKADLQSAQGQQRIYEQMQIASRELCGSTGIQLTESVVKAVANDQCYSGTLTAAVQRLDNQAISELHQAKL